MKITGAGNHSRHGMIQQFGAPRCGAYERLNIHSAFDTRMIQEIQHILSSHVAGGTRRKWTTADSAHGAVDCPRTRIYCGPDIGDCSVAGVVKMNPDGQRMQAFVQTMQQILHLGRNRDPDRSPPTRSTGTVTAASSA